MLNVRTVGRQVVYCLYAYCLSCLTLLVELVETSRCDGISRRTTPSVRPETTVMLMSTRIVLIAFKFGPIKFNVAALAISSSFSRCSSCF